MKRIVRGMAVRTCMIAALAAALGSTGCELVVQFDPNRLDASADAQGDAGGDARLDAGGDVRVNEAGPDAMEAGGDAHVNEAGPDAMEAGGDAGNEAGADAREAGGDAGTDAADATMDAADDVEAAADAADASDDVDAAVDADDAAEAAAPECTVPSDCPGTDGECATRTCLLGRCGFSYTAANTAVAAQTAGDCHVAACDGSGNVVSLVDNADVPNDNNPCTQDVCTSGVPSHPPATSGAACNANGGTVCDGAGNCVQCVAPTDCAGTDTACRVRACNANTCSFQDLGAGTRPAGQVAGDCKVNECDGSGNLLSTNDDTDVPADDGNACTGETCVAGNPTHPPLSSGSGCPGGACDGAGRCIQCAVASDCPGTDGLCQQRTCTAGQCGMNFVAPGTQAGPQTAGDCLANQCDGAGHLVSAPDNTDVPASDGNDCTAETCVNGVPAHPATPRGSACAQNGGTLCDGAGTCVTCVQNADCPAAPNSCSVPVCTSGVCGFSPVAANTPLPAAQQTPGDCRALVCNGTGGIGTVADNTDVPADDGNQCTGDVCVAGDPAHPPLAQGTACTQNGGVACNATGTCVQCFAASDCPGVDTECAMRTCNAGACGAAFATPGTVVSAQSVGDCQENQCDGAGHVVAVVADTDVPVDNNQCTGDVCTNGVPSNPALASGTACSQNGGVVCNATGGCVQCLAASDCPGTDTACKQRACTNGTCGFTFTTAGTPVATQTTGDCRSNQCDGLGNQIAAVDNTDVPVDNNQCTGDVCTAGVPSNPALAAGTTCTQNGGRVCDGSASCVACNVATDCPANNRCVNHACQLDPCLNGTRDGAETDTDCGGGTCGPCVTGKTCAVNADCASGYCDSGRVCRSVIAVLRVGDGTAALSNASTAVFLDRFSAVDGTALATVALPIAAGVNNRPLTISGTATSEGGLSTSVDGRFVTLAGYATAPGTAAVSGTSAAAVPRVIGRVDTLGTVDTSTVLGPLYSAASVRSATSTNGTDLWASGATSGISYTTLGAGTATQITTAANFRWLNVFEGQLYATAAAGTTFGVVAVGTGTPTTSGQAAPVLPGFPTATGPSPYGFVMLDLDGTAGPDRIYVADDRATAGAGGVQRWDLVSGTWTLRYTIPTGSTGARGVTTVSTADPVTLWVTTSTGNAIDTIVDTGAASAFSLVRTSPTNTLYRGITAVR